MTDAGSRKDTLQSVVGGVARGVGWMMLLKVAVRSLGLVSMLILVRLLSPEDFGLVGMATLLIVLVQVFSSFNFDMALIQRQSASRAHYDTAWTLNVVVKSLSAVIIAAGAYPASLFFAEPRVSTIVLVLSGAVLIDGFQNIGVVDFRKKMEFDKEFRFMVLRKLSGFCVTVPLAFMLRSYWALVIGVLSSTVFTVWMSYVMHPYRPRLSLAARDDMLGFSKWLLVCNIMNAVRTRGAEMVIGRVSGAQPLGLFTVSLQISNMPTTDLIAPMNRAIFPGYAKLSKELGPLRSAYLSVIGVIALLAVPAGVGIAATAPVLVPVALGDQWTAATSLVAMLSFYGVMAALQTNIQSVLTALGRTRLLATLYGLHTALVLACTVPATIGWGVEGAAVAYVCAAAMVVPVNFTVVLRVLSMAASDLLGRVWRPVVSSGVMFAAVGSLSEHLTMRPEAYVSVAGLAILCLFGAAVYAAALVLLWMLAGRPAGAERDVLAAARRRLSRTSD